MAATETPKKQQWFIISVVKTSDGRTIKDEADAVFASGVKAALELAYKRNPLRVHESFAVNNTTVLQHRKCVRINERRTAEIAAFTEFMSD